MPRLPTFEEFSTQTRALGFDEVLVRQWAPLQEVAEHRHPFSAKALVIEGEMWLGIVGEPERHLRVGDGFELAARQAHTERYGPQGAIYWVARRPVD